MTTKRRRSPSALFIGLSTLDVIQLVDRVPEADEKIIALDISVAAGGPATNAAVVFAALGGHSTLLTRVSTDPVGALVAADLETQQVTLINADSNSSTQTTVASILVTKSTADRAVISAADRGRSDERPQERRYEDLIVSLQPDVVVVDSYETDISIPVTRAAAASSIPVILDCGGKKLYTDQQLRFVTAAVVSERYRSDGTAAIVKDIHSQGVPFGAITAGSDPITFWTPASDVDTIPVSAVEAVDTLGAGDFFHGALAYFIARDGLTGTSFGDALGLASEVSGLSVQSFGSRSWLTRLPQL